MEDVNIDKNININKNNIKDKDMELKGRTYSNIECSRYSKNENILHSKIQTKEQTTEQNKEEIKVETKEHTKTESNPQNSTSKKRYPIYTTIKTIFILSICIVGVLLLWEVKKYMEMREEYNSIPQFVELPIVEQLTSSQYNTSGGNDPNIIMEHREDIKVLDINQEDWPQGELFIEKKRSEYKSGDLILNIPKLEIEYEVMNGTSQSALKLGPGLYEYSQLPGDGDRNVSIAGHRTGYSDTYKVFLNLDQLKEGDLMYLYNEEKIYIYQYSETKIISKEDWSVIYLQGFSALTLTSCHPIGKNNQRIVVVGELNSIVDNEKDYEFVSHK